MSSLFTERLWESDDRFARALRAALTPASWLYGGVVALRNAGYDGGWLPAAPLGLPTIAIGNLTVGGTGKTPLAAWLVERARAIGARPAVLLRGYGSDEVAVHQMLNPGAIVVPDGDRVRAARAAAALGATGFVLDDAFQHRRVARDANVVLVSADRHREARLLPAGPWREPLASLQRATHIVVTRKRASALQSSELESYLRRVAPSSRTVVVHLAPDGLVQWGRPGQLAVRSLEGADVLAVSAVADPHAFERHLRDVGARVTARRFRDHHRFSDAEAARLAADGAAVKQVVCTLKDAVKLGPIWPPSAPPLWYLSQRVRVEQGAPFLEELARRLASPPTPKTDAHPAGTPAKEHDA